MNVQPHQVLAIRNLNDEGLTSIENGTLILSL